jgi:cupin 2 domain-containing protein
MDLVRGRIASSSSAPPEGEQVTTLVSAGGFRVEQILSGRLPAPAAFTQDHDEWVMVLEGDATLIVDGEQLTLSAGDWLLLPAGCPHTVSETSPGTSWLALHGRAAD